MKKAAVDDIVNTIIRKSAAANPYRQTVEVPSRQDASSAAFLKAGRIDVIPHACEAVGTNAFDGASRLEYMIMPAESFISGGVQRTRCGHCHAQPSFPKKRKSGERHERKERK